MTNHERLAERIIASLAIIASVLLLILCVIVLESPSAPTNPPSDNSSIASPETPAPPAISDENRETHFVDLQPTLDQWITTLTANEQAGVMIYDINNHKVAASYQANKVFDVASIYKLLFAYDGYQQLSLGADQPDQLIAKTSDKGNLNLTQCLDLIVRESYNGCADILAGNQTRIKRVEQIITDLDMQNTHNIGLESTASDLTKLLLAVWQHEHISPQYWLQFADSMLNQPPSSDRTHPTYDWRQGLPAGFSDQVKVYNKVGWEWNGHSWNIYADAAILDFTQLNHSYTMVVLTKNFTNFNKISQLGRMIEDAVYNSDMSIIY